MNPAAGIAEPEPETIMSYAYDAKDYCLPSYLWVPEEVRLMHLQIAESAYTVIQGLRFLHQLRSKRFLAMCPQKQGPVFDKHSRSLQQLFEWKEQCDPANPTLAPAAKIPGAILGFHLNQVAYDTYFTLYFNTLAKFNAIEWSTYCQRMFSIKHVASQQMGHADYMAWLYWWRSEFKPAMSKWQVFVKDVNLPNWEEIVDELYDMIIERVEDSDEITALQFARGVCSCQIKATEGLTKLPPSHRIPDF